MSEETVTYQVDTPDRPVHRTPGDVASNSLLLSLDVRDTDLIAELSAYPEGQNRQDFALTCLKIGALALKQAEGQIDAYAVRNEGERLMETMASQLDQHRQTVTDQVAHALREYFDPNSGRLPERLSQLLKKDGELEQVLRAQVGGEDSTIAQTLARHLGETSPLFKLLSPTDSDGVIQSMSETLSEIMKGERDRILGEFSLDRGDTALSRLVKQISEHNQQTTDGLTKSINEVVGEFSLDKEDSALSRLVNQMQAAQRKISDEFTLDSDVSALARIRKELKELLHEHKKENAQFQEHVLTNLAALQARKQAAASSTLHGNDFEEALYMMMAAHAVPSGDIATATGNTTGLIRNSKVGDVNRPGF